MTEAWLLICFGFGALSLFASVLVLCACRLSSMISRDEERRGIR